MTDGLKRVWSETCDRVAKLEDAGQNHGAFYLETQADLVLKNRLEQLERRVKELERIELV